MSIYFFKIVSLMGGLSLFLFGMENGMSTVLVLSGVSTREALKTYAYRPTTVLEGVGEIPKPAIQCQG